MADPGQTIQQEIQKNFPQFGSIRKQVTYHSVDLVVDYHTDTGDFDQSPPVNQIVWGIFVSVQGGSSPDQAKVTDQVVQSKNKAILIPQLDLEVTPKLDDELTEVVAGTSWRVVGVKIDPADGLWKLTLKPIS